MKPTIFNLCLILVFAYIGVCLTSLSHEENKHDWTQYQSFEIQNKLSTYNYTQTTLTSQIQGVGSSEIDAFYFAFDSQNSISGIQIRVRNPNGYGTASKNLTTIGSGPFTKSYVLPANDRIAIIAVGGTNSINYMQFITAAGCQSEIFGFTMLSPAEKKIITLTSATWRFTGIQMKVR